MWNQFLDILTGRNGRQETEGHAWSANEIPDFVSALSEECDRHVGTVLRVHPDYGYGWTHPDGSPFASHEAPQPFEIHVDEIYEYDGQRRGLVGRVTRESFYYDRFWIVSMTRHQGAWNFTTTPGKHNILLCTERPVLESPDRSAEFKLWPRWTLRGDRQASGFGSIRTLDPADGC